MDLTEIQLFVRPRNDNLTPEVKDNEKQEGDQTNNKETGIDDPDTNAITQDTQHNEAKPKENEPQLDEDIENEAMELTQTIPMKIINSMKIPIQYQNRHLLLTICLMNHYHNQWN